MLEDVNSGVRSTHNAWTTVSGQPLRRKDTELKKGDVIINLGGTHTLTHTRIHPERWLADQRHYIIAQSESAL